MTIRVLIADDHPLFLDGLRLLLDSSPGIEVVGMASDGRQLIELAQREDFDVAVVDIDMPEVDGLAATVRLLEQRPYAKVLVLTMHDEEALVIRLLRAGARGYLLKGSGQGAIARAVQAVAEGDAVFGGSAGTAVLAAAARKVPISVFPELTSREHELLELVARGLDNAAISHELFLSLKSVQNRVSTILSKLRCRSRAELVARARDAGLGG